MIHIPRAGAGGRGRWNKNPEKIYFLTHEYNKVPFYKMLYYI